VPQEEVLKERPEDFPLGFGKGKGCEELLLFLPPKAVEVLKVLYALKESGNSNYYRKPLPPPQANEKTSQLLYGLPEKPLNVNVAAKHPFFHQDTYMPVLQLLFQGEVYKRNNLETI